MDILNSGSFVPLDNREKIDQLIYTARELASEVGRTEGFQDSGQTNQQLGLEMWKGAEYVCRAHEEANIRNLFLSKFLERLREIEKERTAHRASSQPTPVLRELVRPPAPASVSVQVPRAPAPQPVAVALQNVVQDEYLGVVPAEDQFEDTQPSYSDECIPEYDADIEELVDRLDNEDHDEDVDTSFEQIVTESQQNEVATAETSAEETTTESPVAVEQCASSAIPEEEIEPNVAESVGFESISSIVIPEKEPYNFDGCTVTAVVQLLPEAEGVRKCVVSVRTHDFAPMIAIVDVATADALPQISATLGLTFEQYRNELPARAADKVKKEKLATKKQSKVGSKAKSTTVQSYAATSLETPAMPAVAAAETAEGQQGLFTS